MLKVIIFLSANLLALTTAYAQNISVDDFEKISGSFPQKITCDESSVYSNEKSFFKSINNVKLNLNVEKFLRDILKKSRVSSIGGKASKYRKLSLSFNGSDCEFKGEYRLTGDLLDHVGLTQPGVIPHSIKIKLKNHHIGNIRKFKLFVPASRAGELEILNTLIHKKLGLLAPRSAMVSVQIGGETYKALFQEDIGKEFLEKNGLHEAILIEGDEGYNPFTNPKIINAKFVASEHFNTIAKEVLETLGPIYHSTNKYYVSNYRRDYDIPLLIDFFPENSKLEFLRFNLLNVALKSLGGLSRDDSRIVYDHISRTFRPIYYDGHISDSFPNLLDINFSIPDEIRFKLLDDLRALDFSDLALELSGLGVSLSDQKLKSIINEAIEFIQNLEIEDKNHRELEITDATFISQASKLLFNKNKDLKETTVSWLSGPTELTVCQLTKNKTACETEMQSQSNRLRYSIQPQSIESGIFLHGLKNKFINFAYFKEFNENRLTIPDSGTIVEHTKNLKVHIDEDKRIIEIHNSGIKTDTSQIIVSKGFLNDWTFIVNEDVHLGYEPQPGTRASKFGLTGCITFNDISLKSLKVVLNQAHCEDGLHFVRAVGSVKSIIMGKTDFDGVDADFSQVNFLKLRIFDAGNDCVDFSAGSYEIVDAAFDKCGDKGLSAGEGSEVYFINGQIKNALIGLVSKDGSVVEVEKVKLGNVSLCAAAYRKKVEFTGGILQAKNIDCALDNFFQQKYSSIRFIK